MAHDCYWIAKIIQDEIFHKDSNLEASLPINIWKDGVCDS